MPFYCKTCNHKLSLEDLGEEFCPKCGTDISDANELSSEPDGEGWIRCGTWLSIFTLVIVFSYILTKCT